jgi:hypothetical protein
MATRKRKKPTTLALLVIGTLSVSGVAALTNYVVNTPKASRVTETQSETNKQLGIKGPDIKVQRQEVQNPKESTIKVLVPKFVNQELTFTTESAEVPKGTDPKVYAIEKFLERSRVASKDARVLGVSLGDSGNALVSFNDKVMGMGSDDEGIFLRGIVETLKQFPEVQTVEFAVDGQIVDTFGHIEISGPQPVNSSSSSKPDPQP